MPKKSLECSQDQLIFNPASDFIFHHIFLYICSFVISKSARHIWRAYPSALTQEILQSSCFYDILNYILICFCWVFLLCYTGHKYFCFSLVVVCFWWYWGIDWGQVLRPCACQTGTILLKPCSQSVLPWLFLRQGLTFICREVWIAILLFILHATMSSFY